MDSVVKQFLPLKRLCLDEKFQHRDGGLNEAAVQRYMECLDEINERAPVVVFKEGNKYWLPGGFHRYAAFDRGGRDIMRCEVREGTWEDAYKFSLGENAGHGLYRSNADKRKAVLDAMTLSKERSLQWSDREICRLCKVGPAYLTNLRQRECELLESSNSYEGGAEIGQVQFPDEEGAESDFVDPDSAAGAESADESDAPSVGDGTYAEVQKLVSEGRVDAETAAEVAKLKPDAQGTFVRVVKEGYTPAQALESAKKGGKRPPKDEPKAEAPATDSAGTPIPEVAKPAFEAASQITAVCREIDGIAKRIEEVAKGPGGRLIRLESVKQQLADAKGNLWSNRPTHVCPYCHGNPKTKPCECCKGSGWTAKHVWQAAPGTNGKG